MPDAAGAAGSITAPAAPMTMRDYIAQQAEKYQIPADLALAITHTESGGRMGAISPKGATGFFQLMPETAKSLGVDATDPFQNIDGGLRYFKQLKDAHGGDVRLALAAYNAGPNHAALQAGQVPAIPETQDYVKKVLAAWQAGGASQPASVPAAAGKTATPPPAFATAGMQPASPTGAKQIAPPANLFESAVVAPVVGFGKQVAKSMGDVGRLAERVAGVSLPDMPAGDLTQRSTGEKVGGFAEQAAEFAVPEAYVSKAAKSMQVATRLVKLGVTPGRARLMAAAVEGGLQAGPAAAIAETHGDDPTATAIISAAMPIASTMVTNMAPAIRKAAVTRMARFMERGVKGDITPEVTRGLAQAASDFIDLPLQRTWRQTAAMTRGVRRQAGETLESALGGPLGDVPIAKAPIYSALDDLVTDVQHLTPDTLVKGHTRTVTYRPEVVTAVNDLKSLLNEYPPDIPARQLHDIKAVWQKAIYPIREAGQPISSLNELLTTAQKEARQRGSTAIMNVLKSDAPKIASLDTAVSHAIKLDQYVKRIAVQARSGRLASPAMQRVIRTAGGAAGFGAGSVIGHPFIGSSVGYATGAMLTKAIESPGWRLLPIAGRRRLADALASSNGEIVRKIVTPMVLAATGDQDDLTSESDASSAASSSSASR